MVAILRLQLPVVVTDVSSLATAACETYAVSAGYRSGRPFKQSDDAFVVSRSTICQVGGYLKFKMLKVNFVATTKQLIVALQLSGLADVLGASL